MVPQQKTVIILGNGGVGKTSIVNRMLREKIPKTYLATEGVNTRTFVNDKMNLKIYDFPGQEMYGGEYYYYDTVKDTDIAIVVVDLTNFLSLTSGVNHWLEYAKRLPPNVIICGNKCDLLPANKVISFLGMHKIDHIKVSAKTGENFDDLLRNLKEESTK